VYGCQPCPILELQTPRSLRAHLCLYRDRTRDLPICPAKSVYLYVKKTLFSQSLLPRACENYSCHYNFNTSLFILPIKNRPHVRRFSSTYTLYLKLYTIPHSCNAVTTGNRRLASIPPEVTLFIVIGLQVK
jgi:hypothetical protein